MDPASLSMIMKALEPALGLLALAVLPIGIIYLRTSYKIRMRELELQEKMTPRHLEPRLAAIEERLASIESAVGAPARNALEQRAALLEGPATGATEAAPPVRSRER